MAIEQGKLKTQYQGLADDLRRLERQENELTPGALKAVRWLTDWVSEADGTRESFDQEIQKAREELQGAQRQLQAGNLDVASFSLERADRILNRAGRLWGHYLKAALEGAQDLEADLSPVRNGCLVTAGLFFGSYYLAPLLGLEISTAGALATAAGLHVGGLTYVSHLKDAPQNLGSQVPSWAISWKGDSEEKKDELTQLAAETQDLLKAWYKDHSTDIPHGELYTRWEVATHPDPLVRSKKEFLLQKWKEDEVDYKAVVSANAPFEAQVSSLMDHLYEGEFGHYNPDNALLIDQAQGLGGNCEARSKRAIAALFSTIRFPKDRVPALQPIQYPIAHLQPVIATLDKNHKVVEVWDLVSDPHGKSKTRRVEGPLYHAALLLHGHLLGQDLPSPLQDKDFLIQKADLLPSWASIVNFLTSYWMKSSSLLESALKDTDSKLILPEGEGYLEPGNLQEHRSENPYNENHSSSLYPLAATGGTIEDPEHETKGLFLGDVTKGFNFPQDRIDLVLPLDFDFNVMPCAGRRLEHNCWAVLFRKADTQYYYNRLPTEEEKWSFLFDLSRRRLAEHFQSHPKFEIFTHEDQIDRLSQWIEKTSGIWRQFVDVKDHLYFMQKFPHADEDEADRILFDLLRQKDPKTAEVLEEGRNFFERLKNHPEEFLPILNEIPSSIRKKVIHLLGEDFPLTDKGSIISLYNLVADPSRVVIGDKIRQLRKSPTSETVKKAGTDGIEAESDTKSEIFVEIELLDEPHIKLGQKSKEDRAEEESSLDQKKEKSEEAISSPSAAITISPEFFLDLLSYADGPELYKRWTPSFSKAFLKLNRDGRYDDEFLKIYGKIAMSLKEQGDNLFPPHQGKVEVISVPPHLALIFNEILRRQKLEDANRKVVAGIAAERK